MDNNDEKIAFRKEALKKLYSSEDLEKVLYVTKPINWIALGVLLLISIAAIIWSFLGSITTIVPCEGIFLNLTEFKSIVIPSQGHVMSINVLIGDMIKEGDIIATIWDETQKKEVEITSPSTGVVSNIFVEKGAPVIIDQVIAKVQNDVKGVSENDKFYCFVAARKGDEIKVGMKAVVYPWGLSEKDAGGIKAIVEKMSYLPASDYYFKSIYLNESFIRNLTKDYTFIPLTVKPILSKEKKLIWTTKKGADELALGTLASVQVYISSKRPISYLFPNWFQNKSY